MAKEVRIMRYNFYEPMLDVSCVLLVGDNPGRVIDFLAQDMGVPKAEQTVSPKAVDGFHYVISKQEGHKVDGNVIWIKKADILTLVHEIVHLVAASFEQRMIPMRRENDEVFAYATTYWLKVMWASVKPKRKVKK